MAVGRPGFLKRKAEKKLLAYPGDRRQRRVIEHEMDMDRVDRQSSPPLYRSSAFLWLLQVARRLMGLDDRVVKPPRRAVAREYEEVWPSRE